MDDSMKGGDKKSSQDTGRAACAVAAPRRVPTNEDELKIFLRDEVNRRHEFSKIILEYLKGSESNKDSIQDLAQKLQDADNVIHSLLGHIIMVEKREKGNLNRDSGVGDSSNDTRRHAMCLSGQGLPELPRSFSLSRADLPGLVSQIRATEHSDNDSSSSSSQ